MEKEQVLSRPLVFLFLALICTFLWGSAFPALKTSYLSWELLKTLMVRKYN